MGLDAHWFPLALSASIEASTSAGTRFEGQELVVWRDAGGTAHVWEDRCPHRGMRLSFGFVRGDHIACLYHGWQYDTSGQCRYVPAHPTLDVPKTIKVPVYRTVERASMIWATLSDAPAPDLPADMTPLRTVYAGCDLAQARDVVASTLPPAAIAGDAGWVSDVLFRVMTGAGAVMIGLQPFTPQRTALHIVTEAGVDGSVLLDWALDLRRRMEDRADHGVLADLAGARA